MLKKPFLVIGMVLALLIASVAPVFADTGGNITGTFGINAAGAAAPVMDIVKYDPGTSMTPQEETDCEIKVKVSDADTLADISSLVLKLWYDSDGGDPTESEFHNASADSNGQNCAVITWTHSGIISNVQLTGGGTTWEVNPTKLPSLLADFAKTTFEFKFKITPGKVATETTGSAIWQIAAEATDSQGQTNEWSSNSYDAEGAIMNFYSEIVVPSGSDATVDWGNLTPGIDFDDSYMPFGTVSYICNGNFDREVRTDAIWHGAGGDDAILDETGACLNPQEFALKASITGNLADAELVKAADNVVIGSGTQTTENTDDITTMTLWLKLASSFENDTYSGTITYTIVNDL